MHNVLKINMPQALSCRQQLTFGSLSKPSEWQVNPLACESSLVALSSYVGVIPNDLSEHAVHGLLQFLHT
jgi:hypothetical protein